MLICVCYIVVFEFSVAYIFFRSIFVMCFFFCRQNQQINLSVTLPLCSTLSIIYTSSPCLSSWKQRTKNSYSRLLAPHSPSFIWYNKRMVHKMWRANDRENAMYIQMEENGERTKKKKKEEEINKEMQKWIKVKPLYSQHSASKIGEYEAHLFCI